ncbi:hypothetical protein [Leptospira meyeri]|uniref:hypothetical protein n=1 Tax=Leptospira meyeri TaxID=29508 RepID=UPI000C298EF7|nr:hypothetical protein [Leptospira meyeri]PJZ79266.1 hypothetical protein CH359_19020 [Leptospira meyeri]PJZ95100.1 hypothetical protein CH358_18980 [Leptospira meyeri]
MAKLCLQDITEERFKRNRINSLCVVRWGKLQREYGKESMNIKDVKRVTNRTTWNCLKKYNKKNHEVYSKIGYLGYAFTISRGDKEADMKELKVALVKTLYYMNAKIYRYRMKGLEIPIMTFEGNSIDEKYNPHLHGYILIPKGEVRNFKRKLREELANSLINHPKLNCLRRKANKLWMEKIEGDGVQYFGYCGREESPKLGQELDKLDWDLSSFGFVSEPNHKMSKRLMKRIYRRFPETEANSELFHRVICMLHWIHKRKSMPYYLRTFIPPFETFKFPKEQKTKNKSSNLYQTREPHLSRIPTSDKNTYDRIIWNQCSTPRSSFPLK